MLSILIPTYNHNVCPLIEELSSQLSKEKVPYEIICLDDASTQQFQECEKHITKFPNTFYERLPKNTGRSKIRNLLVDRARFEWILFMDADTLPTSDKYIHTYLKIIKHNPDSQVYFGGIQYRKSDYKQECSLRYRYGTKRESMPVKKRNKHPYSSLLMSNTLITKKVFDKIAFNDKISLYGHEDAVFSFDLYAMDYVVKHIDNPSYHTGLENNPVFLEKSRIAVKNLWYLHKQSLIHPEINKLLRYYLLLRKWRLVYITGKFFNKFHKQMEKKLMKDYPSLKLFDFYRLSYLCSVSRWEQ